MEQVQASAKVHSINVTSRKKAEICGVQKVISACDTAVNLKTADGDLSLTGTELKIAKFNELDGSLTIDGKFNQIKYSAAKEPFIKRIFK